jgi:hypothetical protein
VVRLRRRVRSGAAASRQSEANADDDGAPLAVLPNGSAGWQAHRNKNARRGGAWSIGRVEEEVFFFEKRNQKTFAPALSPPGALWCLLARNQTDKSFLVLFFKKEHFLSKRT